MHQHPRWLDCPIDGGFLEALPLSNKGRVGPGFLESVRAIVLYLMPLYSATQVEESLVGESYLRLAQKRIGFRVGLIVLSTGAS